MNNNPKKPAKKKPAKHRRPSKLESERLRGAILQDLKANFPIYLVMERNDCSRSVVELVQTQHQEEIREHNRVYLAIRQEKINHFLEGEQANIIELVTATATAFMTGTHI